MFNILIAKTCEGDYFVLVEQMKRSDLKLERERKKFYCPQCHEQLLLKVGNYKVPHFSHQKQSACRSLFSEGESAIHLAGKQQLYTFFKEIKQLNVQMEPYIKKLAQRPDLLIDTQSGKIPIEFQCSNIPIKEIATRTIGYQNARMHPVWILQTPKKLQQLPQGITVYSLSRFEESFLTACRMGSRIFLTYNPQSKNFHYLSSFLHVEGRRFIVNHRKLSIAKQSFPFAEPNLLKQQEYRSYYSIYTSLRLKFLRNRIFYNRKGIKDPFLKKCYQLRLIPSELPVWIGVPVHFESSFHEHDCEWQLALLYYLTKKGRKIKEVTVNDLYEFGYEYGRMDKVSVSAYEKYVAFLMLIGISSVYDQLPEEKLAQLENNLTEYLQKGKKIEKI